MPGEEPKINPEKDLNKQNQSDISLFAGKFFWRSDIWKVISQINWPLKFPSRATTQKPKETQWQWFLTYFIDNSSFDRTENNVLVKIPLNIFDSQDIDDARTKWKEEFSRIVQAYKDWYDWLIKLHEKWEYTHPPKSAFERWPSNMRIVFELSKTWLREILHAEKTRNAKKVTKK